MGMKGISAHAFSMGRKQRICWRKEGDFDLILLDIMPPEIDGYELLEYIRSMEIPVIFLTARGTVNDRVQGLNPGLAGRISRST